jgi:putative inorganic carbon (HCO3(-)) transporter
MNVSSSSYRQRSPIIPRPLRTKSSAHGLEILSTDLSSLKVGKVIAAYLATPASFKLLCLYLFFEYVRPQSLYPILEGPPWALGSLLAACLAFFMEGKRPVLPRPILLTLMVFSVIFVASGIFGYVPSDATKELKIYINWIILIVLVCGTATTERRWYLLLFLYMAFCLKMSQHGFFSWARRGFSFSSWGVTGGPNWFQNSGEFALQMGMFAPLSLYVLLAIRKHLSWWKKLLFLFLPFSAVASIVASASRGGLLAIVVIAVWAAMRSRYRFRAFLVCSLTLPLLWFSVPDDFKRRFDTAGSDATSLIRLKYWRIGMEMARDHPILGVGQGSWVRYYRDFYYTAGDPLNRYDGNGNLVVQPAHNSFVEVAAQLGYVGLISFLAIIGALFVVNYRTRKMALRLGEGGRFFGLCAKAMDDGVIAFCVAGFFMSVAYYPFLWMQVGLTASLYAATERKLKLQRLSGAVRP